MLIQTFYIFMTALFASLVMVPALRRWAIEKGAFDIPDERKVHTNPIPRIGGIGICLAFLLAMWIHVDMTSQMRGVLAGTWVLLVTGMVDDFYGLSPKYKFLGQIGASILTILFGGLYLHSLGNLFGAGEILIPKWIGIPFTVFAVVGVINAMNLIDGLDGLAGGLTSIALGAFFLLGFHVGNTFVMVVSAGFLGGTLGFLKYNSFPARIFMGDTGSLLCGFILGFLAIGLTQEADLPVAPIVPFIILGLPIIDTIWVMTCRVRKRMNPFSPDKTHVHHVFLALGLNHRFTVMAIYGISLFWTVIAIIAHKLPEVVLLFFYLGMMVVFYLGLRHLVKNHHKYPVMQKDSDRSLRETGIYLKLNDLASRSVTVLSWVMLLFLLTASLIFSASGDLAFRVTTIVLVSGVGLLLLTRNTANHFLLVFLYVAGLVIVFQTEHIGAEKILGLVSVETWTGVLFATAIFLVAFKVVFKRKDEQILSTPLDFLLLSMSLSLVIVSPELQIAYRLPQVVSKAIVLFLAFKVIASESRPAPGMVFWSVQAVLAVLVGRGLVG